MSLLSEWYAMSGRIKSLVDGTNTLAQLLQINSGDPYNSQGAFNDQATEIFAIVRTFLTTYSDKLN